MRLALFDENGNEVVTVDADRPQVGELFIIAREGPPPERYIRDVRLVERVGYSVGLGGHCQCDVTLSLVMSSDEFSAYMQAQKEQKHAS